MEKNSHLILIGFMGSGKSTVGAMLGKSLHMPVIDTDQLIEEQQGCLISDIFKDYGEEAFRIMETELLQSLHSLKEPMVISTGGGLPLREENAILLKKLGLVVWLDVSKDTVLRRLRHDTKRPLLRGPDVEERIESLLRERKELYRRASNVKVNVDGATVKDIVTEIIGQYETVKKSYNK